MDRLQRDAVLLSLLAELQERGSWCGETHIQKTTYFLQELLRVPLGFEFILYKHGPYSFDLSDALTALLADKLLAIHVRSPNYGPSLLPSEASRGFLELYPVTRARFADPVRFVAERLSRKYVKELEKVATALYVTRTQPTGSDVQTRAEQISRLKPHISVEEGKAAVQFVDALTAEAQDLIAA